MGDSSQRRLQRSSGAVLLTAALIGAGCGGEASTVTVGGKISHQNKPISSGLINFRPTKGTVLGGAINSDGTYEFALPPGEYQVRIDAPGATPEWKEGDPPPKPAVRQAPEKYSSFEASGLTATVKDDSSSQTIDFALP